MNMRDILTKLAAISEAPALNPKDIENKAVDVAAQMQKANIGQAADSIVGKFDQQAANVAKMGDKELLQQPGVNPQNLAKVKSAWADYKTTRAGQQYGTLPGQTPMANVEKQAWNKANAANPALAQKVASKNAPAPNPALAQKVASKNAPAPKPKTNKIQNFPGDNDNN